MGFFTTYALYKLVHPYYIINILLSVSFVVMKTTEPTCSYLFEDCELSHRESEIMFFTGVIIVFRTRKQGALNILPYVTTACMFAKLGSMALWFSSDPMYGIIFSVLCLVQLLILPEPTYKGPENILYFKYEDLKEQIEKDKRVTWLVEFYATWNPKCIDFAATFSEISSKYSCDKLKFGKVDVTRSPEAADKFKINTNYLSQQLPTLIMFKDGKEDSRRPMVTDKNKLYPFSWNFDNVVASFDLNNIFEESKTNPIPKETTEADESSDSKVESKTGKQKKKETKKKK